MSIYIYIYNYLSITILAQGFDPWEQEQEQEQETQKNILKCTETHRKALGNMCMAPQGPTLIRAWSLDAPGSFFVHRPRANSLACCRAPLPVCMLCSPCLAAAETCVCRFCIYTPLCVCVYIYRSIFDMCAHVCIHIHRYWAIVQSGASFAQFLSMFHWGAEWRQSQILPHHWNLSIV